VRIPSNITTVLLAGNVQNLQTDYDEIFAVRNNRLTYRSYPA